MKVDIKRDGVTPSVRPVPTDNTLAVLPLTTDRVGKDVASDEFKDTAVAVDSTDDAFAKFKPAVHVNKTIDDTEFVVDLEFKNLNDFDPERVLSRKANQRNDLADLHGRVQLLNQLRTRFAQQKVKKAWGNQEQRAQLISAVQQFQQQITKIAGGDV